VNYAATGAGMAQVRIKLNFFICLAFSDQIAYFSSSSSSSQALSRAQSFRT
jgi:hypothetical protein